MENKAGDQYFYAVWSDQVDSSRIKSYESPEQRNKSKNTAEISSIFGLPKNTLKIKLRGISGFRFFFLEKKTEFSRFSRFLTKNDRLWRHVTSRIFGAQRTDSRSVLPWGGATRIS